MSVLFTLVLIAAAVGIFKPYINGAKRWHFGLAAFAAFILIGITAPNTANDNPQAAADKTEAVNTVSSENNPTETAKTAEPESAWYYSESKDEMRGETTYYAQLEGTNTLSLGFPYGDQKGKVLVRKSPQFGFDVLVGVDSGQILCNSYSNSHINVKFDDGPIRRFGCNDASDGTNNMIFVEGAKGFLASLKKSTTMVVEAEFYQNGMQQMTFNTAGLKWEH
jgi:hypothetical protein